MLGIQSCGIVKQEKWHLLKLWQPKKVSNMKYPQSGLSNLDMLGQTTARSRKLKVFLQKINFTSYTFLHWATIFQQHRILISQMSSFWSNLGKFCVFLHHYGGPVIGLWSLMLNSYGRKKDLRKCKKEMNLQSKHDWTLQSIKNSK